MLEIYYIRTLFSKCYPRKIDIIIIIIFVNIINFPKQWKNSRFSPGQHINTRRYRKHGNFIILQTGTLHLETGKYTCI